MRRKRNWILKRVVLGFAVVALVVPGAAKAVVDEGQGQKASAGLVAEAGDYGMPRAMPTDYAVQRGDAIEIARLEPRSTSSPQLASTGFDWSDAGIGAGLILGFVLVGGAAFYSTRHLGKTQTA